MASGAGGTVQRLASETPSRGEGDPSPPMAIKNGIANEYYYFSISYREFDKVCYGTHPLIAQRL